MPSILYPASEVLPHTTDWMALAKHALRGDLCDRLKPNHHLLVLEKHTATQHRAKLSTTKRKRASLWTHTKVEIFACRPSEQSPQRSTGCGLTGLTISETYGCVFFRGPSFFLFYLKKKKKTQGTPTLLGVQPPPKSTNMGDPKKLVYPANCPEKPSFPKVSLQVLLQTKRAKSARSMMTLFGCCTHVNPCRKPCLALKEHCSCRGVATMSVKASRMVPNDGS